VLSLGKAGGLQIRPPEADEKADLVVEVGDKPGATVYLHWQRQTRFFLEPIPGGSPAMGTLTSGGLRFAPKANERE
jgi:hypothetical protein